jgi:hypothetical protein
MTRLFKITAGLLATTFLFFIISTAAHSHALANTSESCHVCQVAQAAKSATPQSTSISLTPHYRSFGLIDFWDVKSSQGRFEIYRNRSPPLS